MGEFTLAFWNVTNLFEPGTVARGPQSEQELQARLDQLASVLNTLSLSGSPEMLGFCEIGSRRIFEELLDRLHGEYDGLWEEAALPTQTGLGFAVAADVFSNLTRKGAQRPTTFARPRCLLVEVDHVSSGQSITIAVNHWKSRMVYGGLDPTRDQQETARWLNETLLESMGEYVIVLGDFNAEPFEPVFNEVGLRAVRHFSSIIHGRTANAMYLYNTAWRWLAEPDLLEALHALSKQVTRPRTSHDASPPVILDHLMVSRQFLLPRSDIKLIEGSVRLHFDSPVGRQLSSGDLKPHRWVWQKAGAFEGCSDHFPLAARFEIA